MFGIPSVAPRRRVSAALLGVGALAFIGVGCSDDEPSSGALVVAAGFAPLEDVVRAVTVGTDVVVATVVPEGEEAHEYEPTAKQLGELGGARALFLLSGFQPSVDAAATALDGEVIDLFSGIERIDSADGVDDPHVWLDPTNMATMATTVADALSRIDPSRESTWRANAAAYAENMKALDEEMSSGLTGCASDLLVTGHDAFGYLAAAYGLRNMPIAGISPSEEPSAATLESLAALARDEGVTTIFFEEGLPGDLSATLADEVGATAAQLDPVEALSADQIAAGDDYASIMRSNLTALRAGLGCP
ncbi:MAG: metal ABC transporter substrate-binding protein [Ilumatobacteraceae bacterium]